jgi:hypothetical protein
MSTAPRSLLPLYDATAPLACTITAGEATGRIELLEKLRASLLAVERTEHGVILHLADTPDALRDAETFAIDEKRCCTFWGFAIEREHGLALRWDGPPETAHLLDRFVAYFDGKAPLGNLVGFL